ncbi:uncharacterized protein EAE97_010364 [Botrytis byssoidea]|uniref:AB hydrolase-1 domain-containing protein n=1 Tax=Botrytis byssoidea TaxID=139641 RepID=A0A9P5I3P3_9HELO|nr:uncharacterized protein EAE97_010364 [Botrytis byssoidea]KAF7926064.1 hypothetical protein EAE97_010364 [Botrytis byssoidea]
MTSKKRATSIITPTQSQGFSMLKFYSALFLGTFILTIWHYGIPSQLISPANLELNNLASVIAKTGWQWKDVEPSESLIWHTCYSTFQCARLSLPLDWLNTSNPSRITLAIIKIPATDLTNYLGPVFTNPGGPGGSGIFSLRRNGHNLQKIVGKNHDIISFDPRGIGASTPLINCWGSSRQNAKIWRLSDVGVVDSHPGMLNDAYARASALSKTCEENMEREAKARGEESLLKFVSTTSVARDMLEIMRKTGTEKLRYWGFSYGTFLGGVFAAMYPDLVERMVSDGNVNYNEWSTNTHTSFLHDSEKIMSAFYHYCHLSGPTICAFYSPTPSQISTRLATLLSQLKIHPILVSPQDASSLPELITYSSLKRLISASLYRPILLFPSLATVLQALETGNGVPFIDLTSTFGMREIFTCDCPHNSCNDLPPPIDDDDDEDSEATADASAAIMCTDGGSLPPSLSAFKTYATNLIASAPAAGAVGAEFRLSCVGRTVPAKWRFTGPFEGNTSHPILYIANAADNVTPLISAKRNAEGFVGARVLVQDSFGHTSLSAGSGCTAGVVRGYFQRGVLPEVGKVCGVEGMPFGGGEMGGRKGVEGDWGRERGEGGEDVDREIRDAVWGLMMNNNGKFERGGI